ncbi:hypothetical protein [Nitratireductor basaltis]|uniref:Uncharacterized protein n=1 Tax=Nitratireductor basaltis TaxID=472175 RepID=A0A084U645_9HYPH|nr:hypothetical protein [Nitratireductor basaltis]KFB08431.1 hypothetical protein EL18_02682 [Nitratireductor basaltis]
MSIITRHRTAPRLRNRTAAIHTYSVGQFATFRNRFDASLPQLCRISGKLPTNGGMPRYRIRKDGEHTEYVATQDELSPVSPAPVDFAPKPTTQS